MPILSALLLLATLCLSACGDETPRSDAGPDGAREGGRDGVCDGGTSLCGTSCVDLRTDDSNCGACRNFCPAGVHCAAGQCSCTSPRSVCDGVCIDTRTDAQNCGSCGHACATGQVCAFGQCGTPCASGTSLCLASSAADAGADAGRSLACVDTRSDLLNCGVCGAVCSPGFACTTGRCTCATGRQVCGTTCADLQTNVQNCGRCSNDCGAGGACSGGRCTCGTGRTACGDACIDTRTDPRNCGACGNSCGASQSCAAGSCVCATGRRACGTSCINPMTDVQNCGACGSDCGPGGACESGQCRCATGLSLCNGSCLDLQSDSRNCRTCGHRCDAGKSCGGGTCVDGVSFRILTLETEACATGSTDVAGDGSRGGLAVSTLRAMYTGSSTTATFDLTTLGNGRATGAIHDAIFGDLATGAVYVLLKANGEEPRRLADNSMSGTITQLGLLDATTGALTATRIPLSAPMTYRNASGLFSGWGRLLYFNGAGNTWYDVSLPSGQVRVVPSTGFAPLRRICEQPSWADWGVAEFFGGELYAVYVKNDTTVERYRVRDGLKSQVAKFDNLGGDTCSLSFSPTLRRWFYQSPTRHRLGDPNTLTYCAATFDQP